MRIPATSNAGRRTRRGPALALISFLVVGCQDGTDRSSTAIDPTIPTAAASMPPLEDGVRRPVGALRHDGIESSLVLDELMITADSPSALDAFISKYDGALLLTIEPPDGSDGETRYLVRVDTRGIETGALIEDLEQLSDVRGGVLEASSDGVLRLLALAARETLNGIEVTLNWVMLGDHISDRTTEEAPRQSGFRDAFDEDYFKTGTAQDIGVGDAWVALERAGKLSNKVKVAVIDGGFIDNPDIDFNVSTRSFVSGDAALDVSNPASCGPVACVPPPGKSILECYANGAACGPGSGCTLVETNPCPWHGAGAAGALAGKHDNQFGGAGPASPVVEELLLAHTSLGAARVCQALTWAANAGAEIINCSFGGRAPAIARVFMQGFALHFFNVSQNRMIFAAAGNDNEDVDAGETPTRDPKLRFPCEFSGVICVGALDESSNYGTGRASYSNYGNQTNFASSLVGHGTVDIWAPPRIRVAPVPGQDGTSRFFSGTSSASPFAAGIGALLLAANPNAAHESVLINTANTGSADSRVTRWVNARDAVLALIEDVPPALEIVSPIDGASFEEGDDVIFEAVVDDLDGQLEDQMVLWSYSRDGGVPVTFQTSAEMPTMTRGDLCDGEYAVSVRASELGGAFTTASASFSVTQPSAPPAACAPRIDIVDPVDESVFPVAAEINLRSVFEDDDPDTNEPIFPIIWREGLLEDAPIIGMGAETTYRVTTGRDTIRVRYGTASDVIVVEGVVTENTPPVASASSPSGTTFDCRFVGQSGCDGQPVVNGRVRIAVVGNGEDEEDGVLPATALRWEWREVGGSTWQDEGTGWIVDVRLPINGGTHQYEVRLMATDLDPVVPLSDSDSIVITIIGPAL